MREEDGWPNKKPEAAVLYSNRLKDVWAIEETAVFSSAHVLDVKSVIL